MTLAVVVIIVLLAVLGVGYLIYKLMGRSQEAVPKATDANDAKHDLVVGTDEQGQAIHASEDLRVPARDDASFDSLLKDEIHDQGREAPAAPDED